ncbi:MAG: hypothetical protein ACREBW_05225 [Candidatus Micrarchaeaceae archaeon]
MKVLVFAPHSAIWVHAFPEALIAEAVGQYGHSITYVGCGGVLRSHCVAMSGNGVMFEANAHTKERVCRLCANAVEVIRAQFGLRGVDLARLVTEEDNSSADTLISTTAPEKYMDLVVDGIEVGRIAPYEMLIQNKKTALAFTELEWGRYRANLKNVLIVLKVMGRLLDEVKPDRVIVYNALYSINRVVCRLCERHGIAQYFLHAGDNLAYRLNTLILARNHAFSYYKHLQVVWEKRRHQPCSGRSMKIATDHLIEVIRGRSPWAYSAAPQGSAGLRELLRIVGRQKVVTATMSSEDERNGSEVIGVVRERTNQLFQRQIDWIEALIEYVRDRTDLCLVIRIHPREFPNKRERVLSEHARGLQDLLRDVPSNVRVNWPDEDVSLFDLANITDVFTNAWSSAGKEMAWLGLPVVLYSRDLTTYPPDLNYVGTTRESYFSALEQALEDGWDSERIRATYRWCAIEYADAAMDISESFSRREGYATPRQWLAGVTRRISPALALRLDCYNRAKRLRAAQKINIVLEGQLESLLEVSSTGENVDAPCSTADETMSLKHEVARLVNALFGETRPPEGKSLHYALREFARA